VTAVVSAEFEGTSRFKVIRRIGAGAMGVVYEAEDRERGQRIALKTLRSADSHTLYRLKREFRALADLSHPNLVSLFELVVGKECFFTMELIHGLDFLGYLRPSTQPQGADQTLEVPVGSLRCDEGRLRGAASQVVEGLMALHRAGKIHRDVKPSNVLVGEDGRAVLVDFGLVTQSDPQVPESFDGHIVGTASYMAPEQCRGDLRLTPAADFYALGVMMYEALTGKLPFEGPSLRVLVDKQQLPPPTPKSLCREIPVDIDQLCTALLALRPEDRPAGPDILQRLGVAAREKRSSTRSMRAAFAGRERELERLESVFALAARDQAAVALVRGPSGIGKSALCQRFLDQARRQHPDLVVVQGRCYERETVPYQAMDSLIDHLSQYWLALPGKDAAALLPREAALLSRLFPVLGRVPCVAEAPRAREIANPQEQRSRAFAALREVLQRLGERRPLALYLDDMQWVDGSTLAVLADLMRPPDPPRLLLLLSTRVEGSQALEELVRGMDTASENIDLEPLPPGDSAELAAMLLGTAEGELASEVAREAGGNPFFIGELVQYVQTLDRTKLGAVRLDELIAERIGQLTPTSRALLQLVALAGQPIARKTLATALGNPSQLTSEAGVLRTLRFIRSAGALSDELVEPYHDRVRDAALASLDDETRRAHHRALALAFEQQSNISEEQLARHWRDAGEIGRASEYSRKAADRALARLDFDRAAELYQMTLQLSAPTGEPRRLLLTAMGNALSNGGRALEAAETLSQATEGANPATRIELRRRSAEELLRGGYVDQGLALIKEVLADFGLRLARTPMRALLAILWRRGLLFLRGLGWRVRSISDIRPRDLAKMDVLDSVATGLGLVDVIRGFDFQTRALFHALQLGEPDRLARAFAREGAFLAAMGNERRAQKVLGLADETAAQSQAPYALAMAALGHGLATFYLALGWRASYDKLLEAERLFSAQGRFGWEVDSAQLGQSFALLQMGELEDLSRRVPAYIREAERRGDRYAAVNLRTRLNIVWLVRDEAARAEEDVTSALASWLPPSMGFFVQDFWALLGLGEAALYAGALESGAQRAAAVMPRLRQSQLLRIPFVRVELTCLLGRMALGRAAATSDSQAKSALLQEGRDCIRKLRREQLSLARSTAALLAATVLRIEGQPREAEALLEATIRELAAAEMNLHVAAARRRLGESFEGERGRALVAEADAWYAAHGVRQPARMTAMVLPGWER
jgi:tRNA A-37 threonylcarbamoyl transferase component Bud32